MATKKEKPPAKEKPAAAEKTEPEHTPGIAADVALYHPKGVLVTIRFRADGPKSLAARVDELLLAGFTERRPFEADGRAVTREQADAAARTAAAMMDQAAKLPTDNGKAEEKPNLDRAKENMRKAVDKAEGKPDEAEKQRVAKLLATWKHFLFVKDGGPNAEAATEATRELIRDEPASVVAHIKKHAIDRWAAETGFEWNKEAKEWFAPKEPEPLGDEPVNW